jgi:imidazolonepropionase-like amidohydrolase
MNHAQRSALAVCSLVLGSASAQDLTPVSPPQTRTVILRGGTVHPVSKPAMENGSVVFAEGTIAHVFTDGELQNFLATTRWAEPGPEVIDVSGKHVYPGLIAPYTTLGISDIVSLRPPTDVNEVGDLTPEVVPANAVNPDSWFLPVARAGGVLAAALFPTGGTIPGQVSVIRMHGWTNDELTIAASAGVIVSWPWMRAQPDEDRPGSDVQPASRRDEPKPLAAMTEAFARAKAYDAERDTYPDRAIDLRWEAMRPLFDAAPNDGAPDTRARVFVLADDADQINAAVAFLSERGLRCVIVGGRDAPLAATLLKRHDVPVIVDSVHRLPKRTDTPYDAQFRLPQTLKTLGIRFCIASGEEPANERNLPHVAGTATAHGLEPADALAAITRWPAEILGVGDRLGTLDPGKAATLLITDGDILEVTTRVTHAWIDGRALDLSTKQTELLKKYEEKYRQKGMLK